MAQSDNQATKPVTLGVVKPDTIKQFEAAPSDPQVLYDQLATQNEALALWLRKRAAELHPDIAEREASAILALELVGIIGNQLTINRLQELLASK